MKIRKKTGKMYIQNIHYAPIVKHLYLQPNLTKRKNMFNKKLKQEIEFLKLQIQSINEVERRHWEYIQAICQGAQQDRKDLNTVIAKINQMKKTETKTKGKK